MSVHKIPSGIKISQSLVKDVINGCCRHYFQKKYVENFETAPTPAMEAGLYFETQLLGSARGGGFAYPLKKNGDPYQVQLDVDKIVQLAKKVCAENSIEFGEVQKCLETDKFIGHLDSYGDIIYDVKYTAEAYDRWFYSFTSELREDFEIQALHYQMLDQIINNDNQILEHGKDVIFLVFSKNEWFRTFRIEYSQERVSEYLYETIGIAFDRMTNLENPTSLMCAKCRIRDFCKNRELKITLENI